MAVGETDRKITDFTDITDRVTGNKVATNASALLRRITLCRSGGCRSRARRHVIAWLLPLTAF